ncbi:MAG: hypothetical protein C0507_08670 [Cyanobacteria bacterium PR.3.49]|nr:hypothetical protein [Cyanobacteria bacterium PR.3.49]
MPSHAPSITLSFAADDSVADGLKPVLPPFTEAQRLKAIESYALIAASHSVSSHNAIDNSNHRNLSSLGLSMRLQDTFRNYLRIDMPNQINHPASTVRHRPSRELRQLFATHEAAKANG